MVLPIPPELLREPTVEEEEPELEVLPIPPELLREPTIEEILPVLRVMLISPWRRKWLLWEWCENHGVRLEAWMVRHVTGLPAGEV